MSSVPDRRAEDRRPRLRHREPPVGREGPAARRRGGAPRLRPGRGRGGRRGGAARSRARSAPVRGPCATAGSRRWPARPSRRACPSSACASGSSSSTRAPTRAPRRPGWACSPVGSRLLAPTVKHPQMQWNQLLRTGARSRSAIRCGGWGSPPGSTSSTPTPRRWVAETVAVCDYGGPVAALVAARRPLGGAVPPREVRAQRPGHALELRGAGGASARARPVMDLYPAIDLRDGGAVRLTQGDFDREARYGDPLELAARFIGGRGPVDPRRRPRRGAHRRAATSGPCWPRSSPWSRRPASGCRPAGASAARTTWPAVLDARGGPRRAGHRRHGGPRPGHPLRPALARPGGRGPGLRDRRPGRPGPDRHRHRPAQGPGLGRQPRPSPSPRCSGAGRASPSGRSWPRPSPATGCSGAPTSPGLPGPALAADARCRSSPRAGWGRSTTCGPWLRLGRRRRLAGVIVGKALVEGRFGVEEAIAACAASG